MSWYYRSNQNPYQSGYNFNHYYPSNYYSSPSQYPNYRGWRVNSPRLDYSQINHSIKGNNHRAQLRDHQVYNDYALKRGKLNADWESRVNKVWPNPNGQYRGQDLGQWGLRDSRRRLAMQGHIDNIFSRY